MRVSRPPSDDLGKAAIFAEQLQTGLMEAVEKNRVKIWEVGAAMGSLWLFSELSGANLDMLLQLLFGKKK